jgi:hypothetical protein
MEFQFMMSILDTALRFLYRASNSPSGYNGPSLEQDGGFLDLNRTLSVSPVAARWYVVLTLGQYVDEDQGPIFVKLRHSYTESTLEVSSNVEVVSPLELAHTRCASK